MPKRVRNYTYYNWLNPAAGAVVSKQNYISIPFTGFSSIEICYLLWHFTLTDSASGKALNRNTADVFGYIELYSYNAGQVQDLGATVDAWVAPETSGMSTFVSECGQTFFNDLIANNQIQVNVVVNNGTIVPIYFKYGYTLGLNVIY